MKNFAYKKVKILYKINTSFILASYRIAIDSEKTPDNGQVIILK